MSWENVRTDTSLVKAHFLQSDTPDMRAFYLNICRCFQLKEVCKTTIDEGDTLYHKPQRKFLETEHEGGDVKLGRNSGLPQEQHLLEWSLSAPHPQLVSEPLWETGNHCCPWSVWSSRTTACSGLTSATTSPVLAAPADCTDVTLQQRDVLKEIIKLAWLWNTWYQSWNAWRLMSQAICKSLVTLAIAYAFARLQGQCWGNACVHKVFLPYKAVSTTIHQGSKAELCTGSATELGPTLGLSLGSGCGLASLRAYNVSRGTQDKTPRAK